MTVNPAPPPVDALLLDLDDTLYDVPAMKAQVAANIQAYMVKYLGVPQEEVYDLCFKCVGWVHADVRWGVGCRVGAIAFGQRIRSS